MNTDSSEYMISLNTLNSVNLKETSSSSSPDSGPSPQSKSLITEEASEVFDDPRYTFVDPKPLGYASPTV